ncbi:ubiquitin carboxyl-terminal hydrolase Usp2 isoform X9 [Sitodiplosis mosellana]|nr:ubiquitin carboxyl-terminal hydrolase Usp2 isoform X9 [Sitodiplosis mosellana]
MPAISTRFPTTRSTYLPSSTVESYRKSSYSSSGIGSGSSAFVDIPFRRSSLIGSYRSVNGDDTSTASGRSGVSTRYTSTSYTIPSTTSTSFTRKSIDRDFRSKPPIGSRVRSESRFRDLSLDNGYTTSSTIKPIIDSSPHSLTNSKRLSTSSLARTVATSGADLYDKYSVANYKPSCELSRSRSLTDSKLIDSLNANHHSSSRRSTSKDRISSGSLLAGSASDRDYLSNHRSTSPISASVKIRNSSVRAALPPTPNRDGKTTSSSISSRILPDTDAFTKSLAASSISDKTSDTDNTEGLCGLRNIGNTCFMNSIIQCLGHTKDLTRYLKTKIDIRSSTAAKDSRIVTEFSKLIKEMWTGATSSVTPSELKLAFSLKHRMYSGCSQQDAQEFLRFFLDALHCALNNGTKGEKLEIDESLSDNIKADRTWEWYSKVEKSVIKDLFVGQLKSSLKCTVCGNSSVTFDPFWDLSVSLPTSSRCKLESCLDLFIKEEVLDGDEMPTCSKCKTRRKSTKSFTIQRFPKYLVIHLKRFSETRWSKLTNIVEFPTGERELNMAPYAANSASVQYTLYGICNHMGSTAGGHYVAVCKHPTTRKWHEFNDNIVSPIYESGLISSSAYVLFYERV